MARDPETIAHQEWLGFVQPVGLVASIPALLQAQAHINKNITPDQEPEQVRIDEAFVLRELHF